MMSRRSFAFSVLFVFLLSVLMITGGCGGGGSNSNKSEQNPNPAPAPEPEPQPEPEDTSQSEAEYALSHVAIGYGNGDNPKYVTQDLTLPVNSDVIEDVIITWTSSNPGVISSNGHVNRQANDTGVTLKVRAEKGTGIAEKSYELTVIRQRRRTPKQAKAEIQVNGVNEIRLMNVSNDNFHITYSAGRDRVTDIDGKYTDITINTADDALDAVQSLHGILGINDPYEELEPSVITSDTYGAEYTFSQVYNGVRVFGRNVTVSANGSGEGDFITSTTMPSSRLAGPNLNFAYTKEQAEKTAKMYYLGSFDVREDMTEKVIFSLYDYEDNLVPAYVVNIYGTDDEGRYLDENMFVNARNGEVILRTTNIQTSEVIETRTAQNELGVSVDFPVVREKWINGTFYVMRDPSTDVVVYNRDSGIGGMFFGNRVSFGEHDPQQVSAYTNMIEVMKWWKASFDRNSLDDKGMTVRVVTHVAGNTDNAGWSRNNQNIDINDRFWNARSSAAAVDVMAHESTHAVLMYRIGKDFSANYVCSVDRTTGEGTATGAINEGYADIFGALMSGQWFNGLHVRSNDSYFRNISDPADSEARENSNIAYRGYNPPHAPRTLQEVHEPYVDEDEEDGIVDKGGVHINCSLVSYPAYRMNTSYDISSNDLAQLWYKSMRMGYSAISDFNTVRKCVMRAARKLNMSDAKISGIAQAFDDVGIREKYSILKGTVSKYGGGVLSGITVGVSDLEHSYNAVTDGNGDYLFELKTGTYSVDINASGYVPFHAIKQVEEGMEHELNIPLVTPTGAHASTLKGKVRDAQTGKALEGVLLKMREGWNVYDGYTTTECLTEADGTYTTPLFAGYHTAEYSKEGYITTSINNLVISSDETVISDVILSRTTDNKYRVTLQWTENPRDLDSHLIGRLPEDTGGGTFHVYFSNKTAGYYDGDYVAFLDHDDTRGNGFETITFQMQPGDTFRYYVHWFAGTGTWGGSNAVVNLYKSTELIGTFPVPNVNLSGGYWHVFDLTDGLDPVKPSDEVPIYYSAPSLP